MRNSVYHSRNVAFGRGPSLLAVLVARRGRRCACKGGIFGKQYEYEEDLYLALDGSATLVVNASVPALVALRGIDLDLTPATQSRSRTDPRSLPVAGRPTVTRVSPPWRRAGRRFVQVRLNVHRRSQAERGVRRSRGRGTRFTCRTAHHVFEQKVGASALAAGHAAERRLERVRDRRIPAAPAEPHPLAQLARSRDQRADRDQRAATSWPGNSTSTDRLDGSAGRYQGRDGQPVDPLIDAVAVRAARSSPRSPCSPSSSGSRCGRAPAKRLHRRGLEVLGARVPFVDPDLCRVSFDLIEVRRVEPFPLLDVVDRND